ncbi:MAG: hypothetical protein Q9201_001915 [Fulgogasparrea decipioides]
MASEHVTATLPDLRQQLDLWYRLKVLLHDLNNVKEPPSEKRPSSTTNELYVSGPYFSEPEAIRIRTALVDNTNDTAVLDSKSASDLKSTIEQALHHKLANFLEKRRASGDARPCGPHDMFPIYSDIFGVSKDELEDRGSRR